MKHSIILIAIALFLSIPTAIQAKTFDFDKMAEMEGVTSVHISKAMFRLLSGMGIKADGIDLQSVMPKLESLQIITCEKPEIIPLLKREAEALSSLPIMCFAPSPLVTSYTGRKATSILTSLVMFVRSREPSSFKRSVTSLRL